MKTCPSFGGLSPKLPKLFDIINTATGGYLGKAFHGFQEVWNFAGNKAFRQAVYDADYQSTRYGASIYKSGSEFVRGARGVTGGTNVAIYKGLSETVAKRTLAHELSHALQNQILGPIKIAISQVLQIAAEIPVSLNPQLGTAKETRGMWTHAIDPFEHSLQSYNGQDIPPSKFKK